MAKSREQKVQVIESLKKRFNQSEIVVFSFFAHKKQKGLTVNDINTLKEQLREYDTEYVVAKKTLADIALRDMLKNAFSLKKAEGSLGILFGYNTHSIGAVKILYQFGKIRNVLDLFGGIFENKPIDKKMVLALAQLPSYETLQGQLVGVLQAPLVMLRNVLEGNMRGLIGVLNQIKT